MDNNDSMKSQQTGGLKLMTVFIAVLALHVVVIGGFTVYHLMSGGSTDADVATTDKPHKDKPTDGSSTAGTDAAQPDKTPADASPTKPATDVASAPAANPVPDVSSPSEMVPPPHGPAPTLKPTSIATIPATMTPAPINANGPITLSPGDAKIDNKLAALANATDAAQQASAPIPTPVPVTTPAPTTTPATTAPLATTPAPVLTPTPAVTTPAPTAQTAIASMGPVHMPPAAKAPSPTHVDAPTYKVKITDSWKKIAASHHVTVAQLKAANHVSGDTLHTGQKLVIPSIGKTSVASSSSVLDAAPVAPVTETPVAMTATVKKKSTASTAAAPAPSSSSHSYTIAKGDTLGKIAHKFKTTPEAIMAVNSLSDPTKLTIGKKLKIPGKESRSAGNSVPVLTPIEPVAQPVVPQPPSVQTRTDDTSAQLANYHKITSSGETGTGDTSF